MLYLPLQSNNVDNLRRTDMDTPINGLGICISKIFGVERILNKLSMLVYNHWHSLYCRDDDICLWKKSDVVAMPSILDFFFDL